MSLILEIAVDTLHDAMLAQACGADRLELVADLQSQGLTPPPDFIAKVKAAVRIPVFTMVRPRAGDFVFDATELEGMLSEAERSLEAGADGLVIGALSATGHINAKAVRSISKRFAGVPLVFHRAFDFVPSVHEALEDLISLGVTRVLTAGIGTWATPQHGDGLQERCQRIMELREQALGRIEIMPGGGVRAENADAFLRTGCTQLHSACRVSASSVPCGTPIVLDEASACALRRAMHAWGH